MKKIRNQIAAVSARKGVFLAMIMLFSTVIAISTAGPVYAKKKKKVKYKYTVTIAHAKNDERGKGSWDSKGSKPGDQTKKEVCMEPLGYYNSWSYVARPKSRKAAKTIAKQAIAGCKNNKIGYGKGDPSLSTAAEAVKYNLKNIKKKVYTDCFLFVEVCCNAAGIVASPIYLDDPAQAEEEKAEYAEWGEEPPQRSYDVFDVLKDKAHRKKIKPENLKVGDILVRKTKKHRHAAIVCKIKKKKIR